MSTTNLKPTEKLALIALDFDIWSGQSRLKEEDVILGDGGEIPPSELASLGSKRICDPKKLRSFGKLKTRARRVILDYGRPFLGGFAIPRSKVDEVNARLGAIKMEFYDEVEEFSRDYEVNLELWLKEVPDRYHIAVRRSSLTGAEVRNRFDLDYQIVNIVAASEEDEQRMEKRVSSLGSALLEEVVERAQDFASEYLVGDRDAVASTTKKTLIKLRDKVAGLQFLDGKFGKIVDLLDEAIKAYPEKGALRDIQFTTVLSIILILSDRKKVKDFMSSDLSIDAIVAAHAASKSDPGGNENSSEDTASVASKDEDDDLFF